MSINVNYFFFNNLYFVNTFSFENQNMKYANHVCSEVINELIQSSPKKEHSTTFLSTVSYKCIFHKNLYLA